MSRDGAFEDEMLFRTLSDHDVERLLRGDAAGAGELAEVAELTEAMRVGLSRPAPENPALVARLAEAARASADGAATAVHPRPRRRRRVASRRLAVAARAFAALAVLPLIFAGLALADVTLPKPARDAFEAVGVSLPNQPPADESRTGGSGENGSGEAGARSGKPSNGNGNSGANGKPESAKQQGAGTAKENPARAGGRANGEQERGRALGKRGLAPGQIQPPGQLRAPGRLKQGGQRRPAAEPARPKPANPTPATPAKKPLVTPAPQPESGGGAKAGEPD